MTKVPDVIQQALQFEERGADYYNDEAQKAKNPLVKRLFSSLAIEEKQHQERIQEIYTALMSGKKWPETVVSDSLEVSIRGYFSGLGEEERRVAENTDALLVAIEMEKKGHAMYRDAAARTAETLEKEFFSAMQKEELDHLEALQNVYYYLTNTEDWFSEEESKTWNWMTF